MTQIIHLEIHVDSPEIVKMLKPLLALSKPTKPMTMKDVVEFSGYSERTIRRFISEGRIKPMQTVERGKLLFNPTDIREMFTPKKKKRARTII